MSLVHHGVDNDDNDTTTTDLNYHIPTDDLEVRTLLRSLNEPITYFAEDKADRRNRLIRLIYSNKELYEQIVNGGIVDDDEDQVMDEDQGQGQDQEEEEYYEPVSEDPIKCDELYYLRVQITEASLKESKLINELEYNEFANFQMTDELQSRRATYNNLKKIDLNSSKIISDRAISQVKFAHYSGGRDDVIVTSSWNGELKILANDDQLTELKCFKEDEKISKFCCLNNNDTIITANFQGMINIYDTSVDEDSQTSTLDSAGPSAKASVKLHETRITDILQHPFLNQLLITSSFDKTFKLYDLTKSTPVYQQYKTHAKEIFALGMNKQGSMLSTCGLDNVVRIWDLRSGKVITDLIGHQSGVYCNDWHPVNGHQLITGSNDQTVKVWDLRNPLHALEDLPIHQKLISDLKFNHDGKWFISSSYDHTVKLTSFDSFQHLKTLRGHDDKIITVDINFNKDHQIISSGWDRSLKIWS